MKRKFLIAFITAFTFILILFASACTNSTEESSSSTDNQVENPTKSVYFDEKVYTVDRFSTLTLNANYVGNETLVWGSSDENVAVVKDGVVLAASVGTAEISVKAGQEEAKCKVAVRETTAYLSLRLAQSEMELAKGKTKTIYASLLDNALKEIPSPFVTYSYVSGDESVVTVDENGVITALTVGETTVTVSAVCAKETIREEIKITVKENVNLSFGKTSVALYANSLNGTVAKTEQLEVFVYQDDERVLAPTLSYSIADETVATVSATGLLTGVRSGETTVAVSYQTTSGTTFSATINVEVVCPIVKAAENLALEVYAARNTQLDFNGYTSYFSQAIKDVEVYDDLGNSISATLKNGIVTLENETLHYGNRVLSFTVNSEVVFTYEAEIITKYISMASELSCFAAKYGKRDATGTYSGWFVLTDNIDMTDVAMDNSYGSDGVWSNKAEYGFKGIFDGQGYAIYNATDDIFGRVSSEGVVKNTAFYSTQPVEMSLISGIFAGRLENVYVCADLSEVARDHYTGVSFRTIEGAVFENVVVEITNKRDSVKSTIIHDAATGGAPTLINVYLISPSAKDPTTETNNIQPIHYAATDANKDFNNLDKSSGYWKNANGVFRFGSCEYFSLERLSTPNQNTFTIEENKVLSWMAVENANGYTVLINGVKQEVQSNSITGISNGMIISIQAKGDGVTFRDSAYSENFIYLEVAGNYLADFSAEAYTQMVVKPTESEYIIPASLTANYVENVTDSKGATAKNAMKVTLVTNNHTVGIGDFDIKLPKATTQTTVTLRFMVSSESTEGLAFRAMNATRASGAKEFTSMQKDVWHTVTYTYTADMDCLKFRICDIKGATGVIYFDCIMDGDCVEELENELLQDVLAELKQDLEEGCLADFSSQLYSNIFVSDASYGPSSMIAQYVENLEDGSGNVAKNALKLTITSPQVGATTQANFKLYLPKSMTNGTHQMRMMVKSEGLSEKWWVRTIKSGGSGDLHLGTPNQQSFTTDTWCSVTVTNAYEKYIHFRVGADDVKNITFTIYFDWVK